MTRGQSLSRLCEIMDRLLAPDGCPWDREQTLETLRPFLVEETYEVLDAMGPGDATNHCEELGDLLMQVVFQAALRQRAGAFDIDGVVAGICDKLVRRHPHVFTAAAADAQALTPAEVLAQWDDIKAREKATAGPAATAAPGESAHAPRTLAGVPSGPALLRAQKLSKKASKVGFDWPDWRGSLDKVTEEAGEVAAAAVTADAKALHHEIGDLLFAVVNLARKFDVDAETALLDAGTRFSKRFEYIEDRLAAKNLRPADSNLAEMDALWNEAKAAQKVSKR
ncbi:MAG: nucleoside triphosphate pyrophosphohydrolase [Myxococcales bacterium]|nr:nucleoside triphosphate pyrophosphohydrolase [Myxococcales bacterium]